MAKTDQKPETSDEQRTEEVQPAKKTYFFPPDFSCEADSLEEAQQLFEQHQKGNAQPA